MKALTSLLSCVSLLALASCASIIEGSTDQINIVTVPPANASCTLTNGRGSFSTFTPTPATVKKSISDLNVQCVDAASGAKGQSTVVSDIEAWDFGNILIGGLIGMGIDWGTGAAYDYPPSTTVSMVAPVVPVPYPASDVPNAPMIAPGTMLAPTTAPTLAPAPFGAPTPPATH